MHIERDRWMHVSAEACRMIVLYYNHVLFVVIVDNLVGAFSPNVDLTVDEIKTM